MSSTNTDSITLAVYEAVANVLGVPHVSGTAALRTELGIDSLTGTFIVARLLIDHGVRVALPALLESDTVDDFVARVRREQR